MEMDILETATCSLCLSSVTRKDCNIIDKQARDMLEILLPTWNLDEGTPLLCNDCSLKLYAAFDFKGTCVNTEDCIFPYVNSEKGGMLDLREIYLKENNSKLSMSEIHNVCRLCMQFIFDEFISLEQLDVNMLNTYIPEINFSSTKDPVICQKCREELKSHSAFLKICLENEKKIKHVDDETKYIKTEEDDLKTKEIKSDLEEDAFNDNKISEPAADQNDETTETKQSESKSYSCDRCSSVSGNMKVLLKHLLTHLGRKCKGLYWCHRCSYTTNRMNDLGTHQLIHWTSSTAQLYSCDECKYKCVYKIHLYQHKSLHKHKKYRCHECNCQTIINNETTHEEPSTGKGCNLPRKTGIHACDKCDVHTPVNMPRFKCQKCSFQTRYRYTIKKHQLTHKDPSELQMYKCDECNYQTRWKLYLRTHKLTHRDPSEIQMYECDKCSFKTKYKKYLPIHKLKHRDPSVIQMHKCDKCSDTSKNGLCSHKLAHMDPSAIKMYECDECSYKTLFKARLRVHNLVHRDHSEIQMYKCDECSFKTKLRFSLKIHETVIHRDPSEIPMYKCDECNYQAKLKKYLYKHKFVHKNPYKCNECSYKTRLKSNFQNHKKLHRNPEGYKCNEIQMYECDECSFKTKHKQNLGLHKLRHRDPSEVKMYKCDKCSYQTKWKKDLSLHKLKHSDPSEIQMYKCDDCDFKTKYRASMRKHKGAHKGRSKKNMQ